MRRLIVGCGYLGERLAVRWRAAGHSVLATTRRRERAEGFARQGIEPVVCDVLDAVSLARLPPVDAVVYCVGLDRTSGATMRQVYVDGLDHLLHALPGRPRLVHVSSTGVYGQADGGWVDESAVTDPTDESGRVVLEAERVLRRHRPDAIVLRFAGIYGPGRLLRAAELKAGRPLAIDPDAWLNLIHVEDGTTAVDAAMARGQPGELVNVCDDAPVRRRDFYTAVAAFLAAPPPTFVPPPAPERVNRRIANARMHAALGVALRYPSAVEALRQRTGFEASPNPDSEAKC